MSEYGRYFEEFIENETIVHPLRKTIFESDNNLFSLLTMNHHPVHLDESYARTTQHGKILVVGTLVFSVAVGITVGDISGKAVANLGYMSVLHLNPVFIGDTISVSTKILGKRISKSKPDRGIVHVESSVYNQDNKKVLTFERKVLVKTKNN